MTRDQLESACPGGDLDATFSLAELHFKESNFDAAKELYEVASHGGHVGATKMLASYHESQGNLNAAKDLYARCGEDPDCTFRLAGLHHRQDNPEKAMELYEIASRGGHVDATKMLVSCHESQGHFEAAKD